MSATPAFDLSWKKQLNHEYTQIFTNNQPVIQTLSVTRSVTREQALTRCFISVNSWMTEVCRMNKLGSRLRGSDELLGCGQEFPDWIFPLTEE